MGDAFATPGFNVHRRDAHGLQKVFDRQALTHARRTGDRRQEALILGEIAFSAWAGPTPADEAAARCRQLVTCGYCRSR